MTGIQILLTGWMAVLGFQLGWIANLTTLAILGLVLVTQPYSLSNRWWLKYLAIANAMFIFTALFWSGLPLDNGIQSVQSFSGGYYLWLATAAGASVLAAYEIKIRGYRE